MDLSKLDLSKLDSYATRDLMAAVKVQAQAPIHKIWAAALVSCVLIIGVGTTVIIAKANMHNSDNNVRIVQINKEK